MDYWHLLSVAGGIESLGMGLLGLLTQMMALKLVGLEFDPGAPHALSEVGATFGGLFIAMSVVALATAEPLAYAAVGAGWLGAGVAQFLSIFYDRIFTGQNWASAILESGLGLVLLAWPIALLA
jgi:hypothetical protein